MIVKAISHRNSSLTAIQNLIEYVFTPNKLIDPQGKRERIILKRYIRGFDPEKWASQFKANDERRSFNHAKRTVLRHEIISFSNKDNQHLTPEILRAFGQFYLKHRSPSSMGICGVHYEQSIHLHFILSAVGVDTKSTRVSREDFKNFKIKLQEFQKEKYPLLEHSIVEHSKKKA